MQNPHAIDRAFVRGHLSRAAARMQAARTPGEREAIYHDLADENIHILEQINEVHGEAGVYRFMLLVEQCKAEMGIGSMQVSPMGNPQRVATQPQQIAGPKASGKGLLWTVAVFLLVGLFLGLARR